MTPIQTDGTPACVTPHDLQNNTPSCIIRANIFEMDKTFVPVILLMFLGITLTSSLKWVERRIAPWSRADA